MVIANKPWKEDSEIEKKFEQFQYGHQQVGESEKPSNEEEDYKYAVLIDRILKLEEKQDENSEYIDLLVRKISELEEKISELENQNRELFMQSIIAQNTESVKELARTCEIDENIVYNPRELEGILSKYSDSQSSAEWVRDVRDSRP